MSSPSETRREHHRTSYPRFLLDAFGEATDGGAGYYVWIFALAAIALVGTNAWANQVASGMATTNMSDHVSWGLYIANFTYTVGLAAGGVMMVIPAYLTGTGTCITSSSSARWSRSPRSSCR